MNVPGARVGPNRIGLVPLLLAILVGLLVVASHADAVARRIVLPSGGAIVVPAGALPTGGRIVVTPLAKKGRVDAAVRGRQYSIRLLGAKRLRKPVRVEIPFNPADIDRNVNAADVIKVSIFSPETAKWRALPTRADYRRRVLVGSLRVLPGSVTGARQSKGIGWPRVAAVDQFRQAFHQVMGSRQPAPSCRGVTPRWIQDYSIHVYGAPVLTCGQSDLQNPNVFEYRMVNNRSYGMWVSFSVRPDWAWERELGFGSSAFAEAHGRSGMYYLSAGGELRAGFSDRSWLTMSIRSSPASETYIAEIATKFTETVGQASGHTGIQSVATLSACRNDAAHILSGNRTRLQKVRDLLGPVVTCGLSVVDIDPVLKGRKGLKLVLRAAGAALMGLDLSAYGGDALEMATGTSWYLSVRAFRTPTSPATPAPAPTPSPAPPAPARRVITVDNRVTNGMGMREDPAPARLTTQPWIRCTSRGCNIAGTERTSGTTFDAAVCQRFGERTTNGDDTSAADDANPQRFESTRYYGVRLTNGTFGYVSEVWINAAHRGGMGLPAC